MIAEPGDDLSTISLPEEIPPSPSASREEVSSRDSSSQSSESQAEASSNATSSSSSTDKPKAADEQRKGSAPKQRDRLYPSVQHIVREKALPDAEIDKIPTSGPNGRLLKGDMLAYLGLIDSSYPSELSARVSKLGHLDLSNIKPSPPKQVADHATTQSESSVVTPSPSSSSPSASAEAEKPITLALPISLDAVLQVQRRIRRVLGIELPLSTFISRATEIANHDLQPASFKEITTVSADRLFNQILGLDQISSSSSSSSSSSVSARAATQLSKGGFTPQITAAVQAKSASRIANRQSRGRHGAIDDIYDLLTAPTATTSLGSRTTQSNSQSIASSSSSSSPSSSSISYYSSSPSSPSPIMKVITLNITNPSTPDEERRARTFLGRVKTILELQPGRLIL